MSDYTKEHGLTFINDDGAEKHSYKDFGIYPKTKGMPDPPKVQTEFLDIPGMDGRLDASQALDGLVHYENRDYEQDFLIVNKEIDWHTVYSTLLNALHGRHMMLIFDDDPLWYYDGRLEVGVPKPDDAGYIVIPIKGTLKPYKYNINTSIDENWLWDPFSFETGVIRGYKDIEVEGSKVITIVGSQMPVVPVITVHSENGDGMQVTYAGTTYQLVDGDNRIPAMTIQADDYDMSFTGIGFVTIYFREGSL
jgi:hypothetical protein